MSGNMSTTEPVMVQPDYSLLYQKYSERLFEKDKVPSKPAPFLKIDDQMVASLGNILVLSGLPKTGKTSLCAAILAACLIEPNEQIDTLGLTIEKNINKKEVVYISTELSEYDFDSYVRKVLFRANKKSKPTNFHCLNLAGDTVEKLNSLTLEFIHDLSTVSRTGILVVLIDGIADFVLNVNDPGPCAEAVQMLMSIARNYNAIVGVIIHKNPGKSRESKMRGHLGSDLARKAEATLELTQRNGHIEITGKDFRNGSIDFRPRVMIYDETKGYFASKENTDDLEWQQPAENNFSVLKAIFLDQGCLAYSTLVKKIMEGTGLKERSAKSRIKSYYEKGILKKNEDGTYSLTPM